jgi:hypothetical protein
MYSTVAANNRAYGADIVPVSYDDIFLAETIFIIGSNTADCHPIVMALLCPVSDKTPQPGLLILPTLMCALIRALTLSVFLWVPVKCETK